MLSTYIKITHYIISACAGIYQSVLRLATGCTVRASNPGGTGERDFLHPSSPPFGPPSPLYYWYRVSFIGVKYEGHGVERTPSSIAEVKEIVELYFFSPSGHVLR